MFLLLRILAFMTTVLAACNCGYAINQTSDVQHAIFTDAIETDFRVSNDVTWSSQQGFTWQVQEYNTSAAASRGPYGKAAQLANVVLNNGNESSMLEDRGVQLWVRRHRLTYGSDQLVPMAEMVTARNDILYGSFRFTMRTTPVNGTCGAAFFYHNDSQEIDMEVLSKQQSSTHGAMQLVVQSPASVMAGFNDANSSSLLDSSLGSSPWVSFAEFRFDWLPDRVDFYVNGSYQWSVYDSIPDFPGQIHLSHWSNGNPGWSAGPPEQDAVLTVSTVHAYFNTSSPDSAAAFESACAIRQEEACIPDAPDFSSTTFPPSTAGPPTATHSSGAVCVRKRKKVWSWTWCSWVLIACWLWLYYPDLGIR